MGQDVQIYQFVTNKLAGLTYWYSSCNACNYENYDGTSSMCNTKHAFPYLQPWMKVEMLDFRYQIRQCEGTLLPSQSRYRENRQTDCHRSGRHYQRVSNIQRDLHCVMNYRSKIAHNPLYNQHWNGKLTVKLKINRKIGGDIIIPFLNCKVWQGELNIVSFGNPDDIGTVQVMLVAGVAWSWECPI